MSVLKIVLEIDSLDELRALETALDDWTEIETCRLNEDAPENDRARANARRRLNAGKTLFLRLRGKP